MWVKLKTIEYRLREKGDCVKINCPSDFHHAFTDFFKRKPKEVLYVFLLNATNEVIGYEKVTEGILTQTILHAREVFRFAIINTCFKIIIAHNHPSGDVRPSEEDIETVKKIREAGKILDIELLDAFIFTDEDYLSFKAEGYWD